MGLVKFSALVSAVSGKVGGNVFSRNVGGSTVRSWAKGTNANTSKQKTQRSRLSMLSTTYAQLTPAQRQSFVDAANLAEHKVANRLGEASNLTGPQFYNKVNLLLISAGLPQITSYSGYWEAPTFSVTRSEWDTEPTEGGVITVEYAPGYTPLVAGTVLCVKISRPVPPGRKPGQERAVIAVNSTSPEVTILDQIVTIALSNELLKSIFGDTPPGYKYRGEVMALSATHPWDQSVGEIQENSTL